MFNFSLGVLKTKINVNLNGFKGHKRKTCLQKSHRDICRHIDGFVNSIWMRACVRCMLLSSSYIYNKDTVDEVKRIDAPTHAYTILI